MGWIETLPEDAGDAREQRILDAVKAGAGTFTWHTLAITVGDHAATIEVMADALMIEGIRVNVSANTCQRIADVLGATLLTPRLADLVYERAEVRLAPCTIQPHSSATRTMLEHSRRVDRAAQGRAGLVAPVGKDWVLTNGFARAPKGHAFNYGWHVPAERHEGTPSLSLSGVRVLQNLAAAHAASFTDYSQVCRLARRACTIGGDVGDLVALMKDPDRSVLVSHEGPLRFVRMPAIPAPDGATATPAIGTPPPTLRAGSRGEAVRWWQLQLGTAADGIFGARTVLETQRWQERHGLAPDGVVGPETWRTAIAAAEGAS